MDDQRLLSRHKPHPTRRGIKKPRARSSTPGRESTSEFIVFGERARREFENSSFPMRIFDRETMKYLAVNDAAVKFYGYTRKEFLALTLKDTRHPDEHAAQLATLKEPAGYLRHRIPRRQIKKSGEIVVVETVIQDILFNGRKARLSLTIDLTARNRALALLAQREQEFESLAEHLPDIVVRFDRDVRHLYVNAAVERLTGLPRETFIGKTHFEIPLPREKAELFDRCMREVFETGRPNTIEFSFDTPAGERFFEAHHIPEFGSNGEVLTALCIGHDITERKRAEDEMRRQKNLFAAIIDNLPVGVFIRDAKTLRYVMRNHFSEKTFGYPVETLAGKTVYDLFPKEQADLTVETDRQALESGQMVDTPELKMLGRSGDLRILHVRKVPVFDDAGQPWLLVGIADDITERKHAEKSLRDSQQWLELAVESSGLALWDSNLVTGEVRRQPRWEELLGCLPGETPGSVDIWRSRVHPEDWPKVKAARDEHLRGSTPYYVSEHRLRTKSGAWIWILDRGRVVERDAAGKPLRMIGGCEDITAQKHAEENRIAQLVHQRDALVREIHHRIKNHLQGIAGLLRNKIGDHPATERLIEETITQLQSVGAVYGLQSEPAEGGVPLYRVVEAVCASVESLSSGSVERRFSVAGTGALWLAETEAVPVAVALNELVFNAIKHCATRDGERSIEVALTERNNDAEIRIVNRGRLSANFDYVRGVGTGTGLELVKTLLSPGGSKLAFDVRGDTVEASLRLRPPLVATRTAKAVA